MKGLGPISRGIAIATLLCFAAPQAEAIEAYQAGTAATQLDDGLIVHVQARRGGGRPGGMHRGGGRPGGMHRGGARHGNRGGFNRGGNVARRGNVNRNINRNVNRNFNRNVNRNFNRNVNRNFNRNVNRNFNRARWGSWRRPGGYWWPAGGAVGAGMALGFISAAAAASWAGAAPGPNLCWYYTDPGRRQGFWDACPF